MTDLVWTLPAQPDQTARWAEPSGGGGSIPSGDGPPAGVVTPSGIGALYIDTTNGGLYIAAGVTDTDWYVVGGVDDIAGTVVPGFVTYDGEYPIVMAPDEDDAYIGIYDAAGFNGTGNGWTWNRGGADGNQYMQIQVGPAGQYTIFLRADGVLDTSAAHGVMFPAADPHVAGAWWDNAGTLTRSAG